MEGCWLFGDMPNSELARFYLPPRARGDAGSGMGLPRALHIQPILRIGGKGALSDREIELKPCLVLQSDLQRFESAGGSDFVLCPRSAHFRVHVRIHRW